MTRGQIGGDQNSLKACPICGEPVDAVQLPGHIAEVHGGEP